MMQALLEDRFKLKLHRETREVPVYALVVAKSDSKLRQFEERTCTPPDPSKQPSEQKPTVCKGSSISGTPRSFVVDWMGGNLDLLSSGLYGIEATDRRPIINRTGITGAFTFRLEFARLLPAQGGAADDPSLPSIFTALEEKLGLKLEPSKGPQEFLVIDNLERPTEN
jgi:uncharacterized protein (TIGR03435 family)